MSDKLVVLFVEDSRWFREQGANHIRESLNIEPIVASTKDDAIISIQSLLELSSGDIITVLDGEMPVSEGVKPMPWYDSILEEYQRFMEQGQMGGERRHFFIPNSGNMSHTKSMVDIISQIPDAILLGENGKPKGLYDGIDRYKEDFS